MWAATHKMHRLVAEASCSGKGRIRGMALGNKQYVEVYHGQQVLRQARLRYLWPLPQTKSSVCAVQSCAIRILVEVENQRAMARRSATVRSLNGTWQRLLNILQAQANEAGRIDWAGSMRSSHLAGLIG